jgi:hypothetical protein
MAGITLSAIFELVRESIAKYLQKLEEKKDRKWERISFALEETKTLTKLHMDAINDVVGPVIDSDDFPATYQRFNDLVNNLDFPLGYEKVRGILVDAYKNWKEFQKDLLRKDLHDVIFWIATFQSAVFFRQYHDEDGNPIGENFIVPEAPCFRVLDIFGHLQLLLDILSSRNPDKPISQTDIDEEHRIKSIVGTLFSPEWTRQFAPQGGLQDIAQVHSAKDLVEFAKTWCRAWQRYTQTQLYIRGHLNSSIECFKNHICSAR